MKGWFTAISITIFRIRWASAVTTVYTGTYPFYHGIVGEKIREGNQSRVSSFDRKVRRLYHRTSIANINKSFPLTDELKIASVGKSDV